MQTMPTVQRRSADAIPQPGTPLPHDSRVAPTIARISMRDSTEEGPGPAGDPSILWGAAEREVAVVAEVIADVSGEYEVSDGDINESNVASDRLSGGGNESAAISASLPGPGFLTALARAAVVSAGISAAD